MLPTSLQPTLPWILAFQPLEVLVELGLLSHRLLSPCKVLNGSRAPFQFYLGNELDIPLRSNLRITPIGYVAQVESKFEQNSGCRKGLLPKTVLDETNRAPCEGQTLR